MISFCNIAKTYYSGSGTIITLQDVSFEIKPKEFVSIVGRSGAGKSTLFKLFLAEETPTKGSIFFEGQDIHLIKSGNLPLFRKKIGVVFQDYKLLSKKTIYENIAYVMEVVGQSDQEIAFDVPKILEIVGLTKRAYNFPKELSGGERQRAAIARALIYRPRVILADEPTGNLDPYHAREIIRLLVKVNEMGTTVLLATHNKWIINNLEKRVITLEEGKIIRDEEKGKFVL